MVPLAAVAALLLAGACTDAGVPSSPDMPGAAPDISDGAHAHASSSSDLVSNPRVYWLPPLAPQPDGSSFGTFDPTLRPEVRIVCLEQSSDRDGDCDPDVALASFSVGRGLTVNDSLYIAPFSPADLGLAISTPESWTRYRIQVRTQALGELGGPFVYGFADFEVGDVGTDANAVTSPGIVGIVDDQTLPIKFRLDEGALAFEVGQNVGQTNGLCAINCSATVLDPHRDTEASLFDLDDPTYELTAMLVTAGAVNDYSVLIIDQRDPDADGNCGPGAVLLKDSCYRYVLLGNSGGSEFNTDVRFGICPDPNGPAVDAGTITDPRWRILKADYIDGEWQITRPTEVDVSDFLTCDVQHLAVWGGPGGRLAGRVLGWFVGPVQAAHFLGGSLRDLSDLFWGLDADLQAVGSTEFPDLAAGTVVQPTVRLMAVHTDPDQPIEGQPVTFEITSGGGSLTTGAGTGSSVTVMTDQDGEAAVDWTVIGDGGTVTATSSVALDGPVTFTATTAAGGPLVLYAVNDGDDGLSVLEVRSGGPTGKVTHVGTTLDAARGNYAAPASMTSDAAGTLYAWNNSGSQGSSAGSLLAVDRCTGTASRLIPNGSSHHDGLAFDATGVLYALDGSAVKLTLRTDDETPLGSYGISGLDIAGADVNPVTGTLYGLEATTAPGASGPRLVTIDRTSGAAAIVATLDEDVGTVGSIVFAPEGTLIGSGFGGKHGDVLFEIDPATGEVSGRTNMSHGEHAPTGMAFAPTCPAR